MRKIAMIIGGLSLMFTACTPAKDNEKVDNGEFDSAFFIGELRAIEDSISNGIPAQKHLVKALVLFQDYVNHFPTSKEAPDYLLRTSDLYLSVNNPNRSVDILNEIIKSYPNYKRLEAVYFNRANHVDFEIRDTSLAKTYYQEFLEKYPNSGLVNDANSRIENIGLSAEQLIEKFEAMNQ
ncbi:hypothetical protein DNU06_00490 [Putridiphycobacter roseus]|uniref:Outer membrane lipoprotein BamD-like domain-containing protein n=1 Tax=Putridiphycobacter roseus TaxID=2219161 RepID=A0A2W1N242_9FLAO|nr:tetratricopeptide repeat protein [Putridiphycobacter roseus]PZE18347.1 hypothetical protein DNU06_00490 [Putridiphycobacter roseus]